MKRIHLLALCAFVLTLAACNPPVDPLKDYGTLKQTGKDFVDPEHGKQAGIWYGAVEGAGATPANGIVFARVFENGTIMITANVNIALAVAPDDYVAELTDDTRTQALSMGSLDSIIGDARHVAKLEITSQDISKFTHFKVYKRANGNDAARTLVAQGTLKAVPAQ